MKTFPPRSARPACTAASTWPIRERGPIVIAASDVVIDFQQFRLRSTTGTNDVLVNSGDDVVIRNGKIDGFVNAIRLSGGRAALVEKMRISETSNIGIVSSTNAPIIRENRIDRAGATAIATSGNQARILDNDITFNENNPYDGIGTVGPQALIQGNRLSQVSGLESRCWAPVALSEAM